MQYGQERILFLQRNIGNRAVNRLLFDRGKQGRGQPEIAAIAQRQEEGGGDSSGSPSTDIEQADEAIVGEGRRIFQEGAQAYSSGQFRRAIIRFERARQMPGITTLTNGALLYNIGRSHMRLHRYAAAVYALEGYVETPGISEASARRGREMLARSQRGAGIDAGISTADARQLFEDGARHYSNGHYEQALTLFERARHLGGGSEQAENSLLYNIGRCNLRLQRFATAIHYFEAAVRGKGVEPDSAEAVAAAAQDADLANYLELLRRARQGAGIPWSRMLFQQMNAMYTAGNYAAALQRLQQIYGSPDLNAVDRNKIVYNLGITNHRMNNFSEAIRYYQECISQGTSEALSNKARTQIQEAQAERPPQSS
jgi:tetratricopeptide (TPR) repeat protein